ncbi:FAS1 domain-containing protein [Xylariaceae sp. FL1272]|nr:FAS1 domain-containing protein [Xylariaceae sp. FL1272]
MRRQFLLAIVGALYAIAVAREILDPVPTPANNYVLPVPSETSTLLDFLQSQPELSNLTAILSQAAGFKEAFSTPATWNWTFFAPSNTAFEKLGQYFNTYAATAKGKWWLGNLLVHHYVPNTALSSTSFNSTLLRFQTGSYLYVSAQVVGDEIVLNKAATITERDITGVTNGVVHIVDRMLDPSAQIFEADIGKVSQSFIAGSCSNLALPYC